MWRGKGYLPRHGARARPKGSPGANKILQGLIFKINFKKG
jgi:hypothetical protein